MFAWKDVAGSREFSQDAVVTAQVELGAQVRGDGEKRKVRELFSGWKVQDIVPH